MKHRGDLTDEQIALAVIHGEGNLHYRICYVERLTGRSRSYIVRVLDEYHEKRELSNDK